MRNLPFTAALLLTGSERVIFLHRECAGDIALRQRVEALLVAHGVTDSFMVDQTEGLRPGKHFVV